MAYERLPKGFGGVIKMRGKRRNPYQVRIQYKRVYDEETEKWKNFYHILGYAPTRKDGIIMLKEYHDNPYDLTVDYTFEEIYTRTCKEFLEGKSKSTINAYHAAFIVCESVHRMSFKDIRVVDLQMIIDTCGKNYPTLKKIKVLFNQMYKYGMKYDIVTKDCSEYVEIAKYSKVNNNSMDRRPFSKKHIDYIWKMSSNRYYQIILMLIYTGCRITEFLELKKENVNLEEQYFDIIKSKTENGIRRVPIADCVLPFFKEWYEYSKAETLICTLDHEPFKYRNYYDSYWQPLFERKGLEEYTPHCTRHTCISLLAEAKIDQTTIKKIVGHRGAMTLTEKTYTHLDVEVLIDAVNQMYHPEP